MGKIICRNGYKIPPEVDAAFADDEERQFVFVETPGKRVPNDDSLRVAINLAELKKKCQLRIIRANSEVGHSLGFPEVSAMVGRIKIA